MEELNDWKEWLVEQWTLEYVEKYDIHPELELYVNSLNVQPSFFKQLCLNTLFLKLKIHNYESLYEKYFAKYLHIFFKPLPELYYRSVSAKTYLAKLERLRQIEEVKQALFDYEHNLNSTALRTLSKYKHKDFAQKLMVENLKLYREIARLIYL